ncbi:MAG: endonuclease III [Francisellaceae bacterium]
MNKQKRQAIFEILKRNNRAPTTELVYHSTFELLIAVILSAQATDKGVNKATALLFEIANTPETLLALGEEHLRDYIKSIGLYRSKAANIIKTCRALIENHNGEVPATREALQSLPGVGRKTANVILNTAFKQPVIAVDTHIFRLANRIGLAPGKDVIEVEEKLIRLIPKTYLHDAHHWLILHGRYICTAKKPKCGICPIFQYCDYKSKEDYL